MKKQIATLLLGACIGFVGGYFMRGGTAKAKPPVAKIAASAVPFLGATLEQCWGMSIGVETNSGWSIIEGGLLFQPLLYGGVDVVNEIEFAREDALPLTGHEVHVLLDGSANGFVWLVYPFGGGRWHRSDGGAWAELEDPGILLITYEDLDW